MRVLLTGATGFIGLRVLERVLSGGSQLKVLALPGTETEVPRDARIGVIVGSLGDRAILETATRQVDIVIHLAGLLPGQSEDELMEVNVNGTVNLAQAAANNHVKRLVFVSSTSVYRDAAKPFATGIDETSPLLTDGATDIELYGLSKVRAEQEILRIQRTANLPSVIVRAPVAYGSEDGWDARLLQTVRQQPWRTLARLPTLPTLQCVHVDDLADGILLAALHSAAGHQVFNMAGAELFSFRDLGRTALSDAAAGSADLLPVYGVNLKYDVRKAQSMIGYAPKLRIRSNVLLDVY